MKSFLILFLVIFACASVTFNPTFSFIKTKNLNNIMINDDKIPDKIFAAEIHYSRIPH